MGLAFAACIAGLGGLERAGALRTGALARRLGAVSYPLYILHLPLLLALAAALGHRHLAPVALAAFGALTLAALYAVCAAVAFGFDQPVQRLLRRRTSDG
jgi:peptidoglycan/LPS O-acetylase OafA/YrhL